MTPTILINLVLGGVTSVLASILAVASIWLNGSLVVAGNQFFDTTNNSYPSQYVNSGAVATYAGAAKLAGGGVRITSSGAWTAGVGFLTAYYQSPSQYGSGAVIDDLNFECGNIGTNVSGSLVINQSTTKGSKTVGNMIHRNIVLSTGAIISVDSLFLTGSTLQQTKLGDSKYISFISNGSGSSVLPPTSDCVMKPVIHEKYGR